MKLVFFLALSVVSPGSSWIAGLWISQALPSRRYDDRCSVQAGWPLWVNAIVGLLSIIISLAVLLMWSRKKSDYSDLSVTVGNRRTFLLSKSLINGRTPKQVHILVHSSHCRIHGILYCPQWSYTTSCDFLGLGIVNTCKASWSGEYLGDLVHCFNRVVPVCCASQYISISCKSLFSLPQGNATVSRYMTCRPTLNSRGTRLKRVPLFRRAKWFFGHFVLNVLE